MIDTLKEQIKKYKLKQKDVAQELGIHHTVISAILNHKREMSKTLEKSFELYFENLQLKEDLEVYKAKIKAYKAKIQEMQEI